MRADSAWISSQNAFTLAEMLVALSVLSIITTFTIPKILVAQQSQKFNAIAKEAAGMLGEAYQIYRINHTVTSTTQMHDILNASLNYVTLDTSSSVDMTPADGMATNNCTAANVCYRLPSGALIWTYTLWFAGTSATNAVYFVLDPDGVVTNRQGNLMSKEVVKAA